MTGELEATVGEVTRNRFLRVGKYSQHFVDVLPMVRGGRGGGRGKRLQCSSKTTGRGAQ